MNWILQLLKNLLIAPLKYLKGHVVLAKAQAKNGSCKFYKDVVIRNTTFGKYNVIFEGTKISDSHIGSHTYIQKHSTVINAAVGKFCSIASHVTIGPGIHETRGLSTHPAFYLRNTPLVKTYSAEDLFASSQRTEIGHDVWIGQGAIIVDGVKIGDGAIIAAGAVVTKDVGAYSVVGGVPAKFLKHRFAENLMTAVMELKWWDKDEAWLAANYRRFSNPAAFIQAMKKEGKGN